MTNLVLKATGSAFDVPLELDMQLLGGPLSLTLSTTQSLSINDVWDLFSSQLESATGVSLPDIPAGPWQAIMDRDITPSLSVTPSTAQGNTAAYLQLALDQPLNIGGTGRYGPVEITFEPNIEVLAILIGYDGDGDGLTVKAKIKTPTTPSVSGKTISPDAGTTEQLVNFPFPIPSQNSISAFKLHYLGIGQRVGPRLQVAGSANPMEEIFNQLENQLVGDDPATIITELAEEFYQPDRDWFIAADLSLREFRLRVLFNDPVMYGLEISVPMSTTPSFFSGLLFEILYQKLGPNLGVYYGSLTLPYAMRRIPLNGFILILPSFSIWVYTNGDFRVNVGWPVSPERSIGISVSVLTGWAGFYFTKLRSGNNPGATPSVNYNPILEFGIGIQVSAGLSIKAGPLSASLAATVAVSMQGLLAWRANENGSGNSLAKPPDHYWFAGAASIAVLLKGSVNLGIIKATVTVSFTATAGIAFETGYQTVIPVSASVRVSVSVKVVFIRIHLSFHTTVTHTFYVGSGTPASIDGPSAPGLSFPEFSVTDILTERAKNASLRIRREMKQPVQLLHNFSVPTRFIREGFEKEQFTDAPIKSSLAELEVVFLLQPTVVYSENTASIKLIASLVMESPAPGEVPLKSPGTATGYEQLIIKLVHWLLTFVPPTLVEIPLSQTLQMLSDDLGTGTEEPGPLFGGTDGFVEKLKAYFEDNLVFSISSFQQTSEEVLQTAAILPMFDELRLQSGNNSVDFSEFNRTPANYLEAIDMYFDNLGLIGSEVPGVGSEILESAETSPLTGPSMASFLFTDYFVLIARYVVSLLIPAAQQYEQDIDQRLQKDIANASAALSEDPFRYVDLVSAHAAASDPGQELSTLLDELDYASVAGFGSRYLMSGLQLPEPDKVPPQLSPEVIADFPVASLFELSGQQFSASEGSATEEACLSFSPGQSAAWISFNGVSPDMVQTEIELPTELPSAPNPNWQAVRSSTQPTSPAENTIDFRALPPLTATPLGFNLKNSLAWSAPGEARTLYTLPQPLMNLVAQKQGVQLALERVDSGAAILGADVEAIPSLAIPLSLRQVQSPTESAMGRSSGLLAEADYSANIYQLNGTDEATRDLIEQALKSDLSDASISLLYQCPGGDKLRSDDLDPSVLLAKLNLSTLNQVEQVSALHAHTFSVLSGADNSDFAPLSDVRNFLRLIWELSVVRAQGFYLYYKTSSGEGLPNDLFADTANATDSPNDPNQGTVLGTSGGTADFTILVQCQNAGNNRVALAPYENSLWVECDSRAPTLATEVFDMNGVPLTNYQPTYEAGNIGFAINWKPVNDDDLIQIPVNGDLPQIRVNELYHLLQYQLVSNGTYGASVWSLPVGPTQSEDEVSPQVDGCLQLRQVIPVFAFLQETWPEVDSPIMANRYDIVGQQTDLAFRICDLYGNPLNIQYRDTITPLYNDPLISPGEWPGVESGFFFIDQNDNTALLKLSMEFNPGIVSATHSPEFSSLAADEKQQWQAIQTRYRLIIDQLTDSNTSLTVTTSLTGTVSIGDPQRELLNFAEQVLEYINQQVNDAVFNAVPSLTEPTISTQFNFPVAFSDVLEQPDDIVEITACLTMKRDSSLVYPPAMTCLPAAAELQFHIPAKLNLPPFPIAQGMATDWISEDSNRITNFARYFEAAFAGFDQAGGVLKLAQRSVQQVADDSNQVPDLWAVRFSEIKGFGISFYSNPVYFALRPLNTTPRSGMVNDIQYNDIDMDAWAQSFLMAVEAFLTAEFGIAVALLDKRYNTVYYDQLMASKQTLATSIPSGLVSILEKDEGQGDIEEAQERLRQALLVNLASAYTISTVVQVPADISASEIIDGTHPQKAPQLFGSIAQPNDEALIKSDADIDKLYQLSAVYLSLDTGKQWATSLLSVTTPEDHSSIQLPLQYNVSYLQHNFEEDSEFLGYVPSSWIKFALPEEAPLLMPITAQAPLNTEAIIPIPLPFEPALPTLLSHSGTGAKHLTELSSSSELRDEILDAMEWTYTVQISTDIASQDDLYFNIIRNQPIAPGQRRITAARKNLGVTDALFEALAEFHQEYPALSAQFNNILSEAYSSGAASQGIPNGEASELVSSFVALVNNVAEAWPTNWDIAEDLLVEDNEIDHFHLTLSGGPGVNTALNTLTLQGQTDRDNDNPAIWPSLSFKDILNGDNFWEPEPSQATEKDGWWELQHSIPAAPLFSPLTLTWTPLDILAYQSANFTSWIVRNAELVPDEKTNPLFIYTTDETSFVNATIPLVERESLNPVAVGPMSEAILQQVMEDIIEPISSVNFAAINPRINLRISYAYSLVSDNSGSSHLMAEAPVLLANALELDTFSPSTTARSVASQVWQWFQNSQLSSDNARLNIGFTLFGTVNGQQLPLVQINKITVLFGST
ncbi:hypothetical protein [Microbulbifer epialgicus]|uniref:LysM domain-containing protein n=1 Tax=Microbulbifer epialgicus TaxID=393907 RepID=A0ABV4P0Y5_9GAMM